MKSADEAHEYLNSICYEKKYVPLAIPAGIVATKSRIITELDAMNVLAIITTKSTQIRPNKGNAEPVIVEPYAGCFGNAVGLRNIGMHGMHYMLQLIHQQHNMRALLVTSLAGSSIDDFSQLIIALDEVSEAFELNVSCPHAAGNYGSSIGSNPDLVYEYVAALRPLTKRPIIVKLTPNVEHCGYIARKAIDAGADGISAINTLCPQMYYEDNTHVSLLQSAPSEKGGKSGQWIHARAIECIQDIRAHIGDTFLLGMGGVRSAYQAYELYHAGAHVVGIGSALAQVKQDKFQSYFMHMRNARVYQKQQQYDAFSMNNIAEKPTMHFIAHEDTLFSQLNRQMGYTAVQITQVYTDSIYSFTYLYGNISLSVKNAAIGQCIFIWIPFVGEKPFFIMSVKPFGICVHACGTVSNALAQLQCGDMLYYRGPYGKSYELLENCTIFASSWYVCLLGAFARMAQERHLIAAIQTNAALPVHIADELITYGISYEIVSEPSNITHILAPVAIARKYARISSVGYYMASPYVLCGVGLCGECVSGAQLCCTYGFMKPLSDLLL